MKVKLDICDAKFLLRVLTAAVTPRATRIHDSIKKQIEAFEIEKLTKEEMLRDRHLNEYK